MWKSFDKYEYYGLYSISQFDLSGQPTFPANHVVFFGPMSTKGGSSFSPWNRSRSDLGNEHSRLLSEEFFHPAPECESREGSIFSSVFTLVSTIIGGGMLSLPYAFSKSGIAFG